MIVRFCKSNSNINKQSSLSPYFIIGYLLFRMETINLRIANWQTTKIDEVCYSVSVKVPFKEEILRLLSKHLERITTPLVFRTGILSTVEYTIDLCLFREYSEPKIGLYTKFTPPTGPTIVEITRIDINYVSETQETLEDSLTNCSPPSGMEMAGCEFWEAKYGWPENTAILFLMIHVINRHSSHFINEEVDFLAPLPENSTKCRINIDKYFLSEELSDVIIQCGKSKFPAHRLVLANKSEYFTAMFSMPLRETKEGRILIEDMDPNSVREMLRFIYQNKIEKPEECVKELFIAADKYGMEDLRAVCERYLLENLSVENVMEVYDLCQMHGQGILLKKAKEILIWNKSKFVSDAQTFKEFTCKYPELMFELFTM